MIKIFDGWIIRADDSCYILTRQYERKNEKTGEVEIAETPAKYYGTIKQAAESLTRILQRKVIAEQTLTAAEAVRALNHIREDVQTAFDGIDKIKRTGKES